MERATVPFTIYDQELDRRVIEAAQMARRRLEDFADQANAGKVHYSARELKRRIWAAFADFDRLVTPTR